MKSEMISLGLTKVWKTSVSLPFTIFTAASSIGSAVLIYLSVASKSKMTKVLSFKNSGTTTSPANKLS